MTLQPRDWTSIPEQTAQIARAAFPKGNIYMRMRDELGMLYEDSDFVTLYRADCGQPALSPSQLALVTVMQFAEGLSDRQTADAVRARLDWKYALGLELTDPGFDFSVLSEFRSRLIQSGRSSQLLEPMLQRFVDKGLIKTRGKAVIHQALADKDLLPGTHLVDTAYVDAQHLLTSQAEYQLDLVGRVPKDTSWQAQAARGFDLSCFQIDWQAEQVTCPVGCQSQSWRLYSDRYGNPEIRVRFRARDCRACSSRSGVYSLPNPLPCFDSTPPGSTSGSGCRTRAPNHPTVQAALCQTRWCRGHHFSSRWCLRATTLSLHRSG